MHDQLSEDEKICRHYQLEKALAAEVLRAPADQRARVTAEAMDRLFREIPWHPLLVMPEGEYDKRLAKKIAQTKSWVPDGKDILDIGCGKGEVLAKLSERSGKCVGIDISEELLKGAPNLPNVSYRAMDASKLDFPNESFDIAFSSQLLEHLHPDDVKTHLTKVSRVLRRGGYYVFDTPSRITGPHDVSKHFDKVATGFHFKEWTYSDLVKLLKQAGFRRIESQLIPAQLAKGFWFRVGRRSVVWKLIGEKICAAIPQKKLRMKVSKTLNINNIIICAWKD